MDQVLDRLIDVVADTDDLEAQVRPLLELLQSVTGLESTYLTTVDLDRDEQAILFARNDAPERFEIAEGRRFPWGDTLCKRALDEGRPFCDDVAGRWGDSNAARGGTSVVVAFVDLDGFEQVNHRFGHEVGDRLLVQIARRWREGLRDGDLIARVGGDEFVVLAFATGSDPDVDAEALRARVATLATGVFDLGSTHLAYDGPSVGAVVSSGVDEDAAAVLRRADRAMVEARLARKPKA